MLYPSMARLCGWSAGPDEIWPVGKRTAHPWHFRRQHWRFLHASDKRPFQIYSPQGLQQNYFGSLLHAVLLWFQSERDLQCPAELCWSGQSCEV